MNIPSVLQTKASALWLSSAGSVSLHCFRVFLKQTELKRHQHSENYSSWIYQNYIKGMNCGRKPAANDIQRLYAENQPWLAPIKGYYKSLFLWKQVNFLPLACWCGCLTVRQLPGLPAQDFNSCSVASRQIIFLLCPALQRTLHFHAK